MSLDKPRILHLSSEKGWRGGERQVQLLTNGLLERNWPCLVACPPDSELFRERKKKDSNLVKPLVIRNELDPIALAQLVQLVRKHEIDLLHAHTSHAHALAWLAGNLTNRPVVVTRRVDFLISTNWFSRRKYLSPRVTFIAISEGVRDVLRAGGVPTERIHLVHSGIDLGRYNYRAGPRDEEAACSLGVRPDEALILNVAALVDHKDHLTLVRAAAELQKIAPRPWKLLIAGSGEEEPRIRHAIAERDLHERVKLLGYVHELAPLYRAADVFVLSSHLEGLCTSILDAMAAGVPVVATNTGGVRDAVRHQQTGLLVPPRNPTELANAILRVLQMPDFARRLAAQARDLVEKEFTADAMVTGTLRVYEKVLADFQ
ncbi:MAG: glycosyltransferase family 4 protein [Candidatus Sumerlaeaceae bacterium]|jgi:glycosyltransferase involved in cell wall biosynthesis